MLTINGVTVRYNIIKKRTEIIVPWLRSSAENADSVGMTHIQSLASRYRIPTGLVPAMVEALSDENAYNPAATWIRSKPWDGKDRLPAICNTLIAQDGYPQALRDLLVYKWLLSVTAAAMMPDGFRCRGVLTLQGPQGIGKTRWGQSLINDPILQASIIKVDHHLDAGNKDSLLGVIDHLIVEIGELESTFRRDVSRLKGFLTSSSDKIRRPYARVAAEYQRRTVFYATVNASDFLVDPTGNSRWWTIPVVSIDYDHGIDMQQVFAQLAVDLKSGHEWWLTADEERELETQNRRHQSVSVVEDRLLAIIDTDEPPLNPGSLMTASEVLVQAGFERPTNSQAKECATLLRTLLGESRRINGRDKWRVAIRLGSPFSEHELSSQAPRLPKKFD